MGHQLLDDRLLGGAAQPLLFLQDQSVGKDGDGEKLDIVGKNELSAPQAGKGLARAHETEGTSWACSETEA